jgi:lipopolysaccharide transport system permease protein
MLAEPVPHRVVIKPNQSWIHLDWAGLWHYRDLLVIMVQRDFTSKYKQTILGPIWFFLNPLITTVVFTLVFSRVLGVPTDGVPPLLFYLCGTLGWGYFSNVLGGTANSLAGNASLFGKVYFPRIIPPLVVTISSLFALGIQLLTFLAFYAWHFGSHALPVLQGPSLRWILFFPVVLHMAMLGLGAGLILSALTAKYRDLQHLQGFLVQIWMYATPVIYPLSRFPAQYRWLAEINPMTAIVEATRRIFLGAGTVELGSYSLSLALSLALFGFGLLLYQHTARSFVDSV